MRPSNLDKVSFSVVKGMNRSLGRSVQPINDTTREGSKSSNNWSRKGGHPTHDQVYDIINTIPDATSVTSKYFDGYNKELGDLTQDELDRLASELISKFPDEYKQYTEETIGSYQGSRKGFVDWDKFIGWENASNYEDRNKFMSTFKDVTGHDYDSDYGEEFDDEDKAQRILDILDGHLGSRNGSRRGFVVPAPNIKQQYTSPGSQIQQPDQGYNDEQIDTLKFETAYSAFQSAEGTHGLIMSDSTKLADVLKDKVTVSYGARSKDEYDEDVEVVQITGNIDVSGEEVERIASQNGLDYYIDPALTNGL